MNNTNVDVFADSTRVSVSTENIPNTEILFNDQESFSINVSKNESLGVLLQHSISSKVSIYDRSVFGNNEGFEIGNATTLSGFYHHQFAKKAEWETITGRWNFNNRVGILHDNPIADLHNAGTSIFEGNASFYGDITSESFASGVTGHGFRYQQSTGTLELDNLYIRKLLQVTEFRIHKIRAVNGSIWVSDTGEITNVVSYPDYWRCFVDSEVLNNFREDDIVRCQIYPVGGGSGRFYIGKVVGDGQDYFDIEKPLIEGNSAPIVGDNVVRQGNATDVNRQGVLYLTASDSGAPFIDILHNVTGSDLTDKIAVRLGRLDGLQWGVDPLYGMGLYGENVFLTGVIKHKDGNWALNADGSGLLAGGNIYWTNTGVLTIGGYASTTDLNNAISGVDTSGALNNFITTTYNPFVTSIGTQLDGKIEYWFQSSDPSLDLSWGDSTARINDIWYNTEFKTSWRWNGTGWDAITDADAIKAIEDAQIALDTADGKRRVFISSTEHPFPDPPYEIGDLWLNSLNNGEGDLYKCVVDNESGSFNSAHWRIATRYTDDTEAIKKSTIYHDPDTNPSLSWVTPSAHIGDVWYTYYDFGGSVGVEIQPHYWDGTSWILNVFKVDGGRLNVGSVTADHIVVDSLLAYSIYATEAQLDGVKIAEGTISADQLKVDQAWINELFAKQAHIGGFEINNVLKSEDENGRGIFLDPEKYEISIQSKSESLGVSSVSMKAGSLTGILDLASSSGATFNSAADSTIMYRSYFRDELQTGQNYTFYVGLHDGGGYAELYDSVPSVANRFSVVSGNNYSSDLRYSIGTVSDGDTRNGRLSKIKGELKITVNRILVKVLGDGTSVDVTNQQDLYIIDRNDDNDSNTELSDLDIMYNFVSKLNFTATDTTSVYWRVEVNLQSDSFGYWDWQGYSWPTYYKWTTAYEHAVRFQSRIDKSTSIYPSIGVTEISTSGFQSVWATNRYFRVDGDNETAFIRSAGNWLHNGIQIATINDINVGNLDLTPYVLLYDLQQSYYTGSFIDLNFSGINHNHDSRYLRKDVDDSTSGTLTISSANNTQLNLGLNSVLSAPDMNFYSGTTLLSSIFYHTSSELFVLFNERTEAAITISAGIDGFRYDSDVGGGIIWHEGNDGPGTNLNAGLLENYRAISFPRKSEDATITGLWTYTNNVFIEGYQNLKGSLSDNISGVTSGFGGTHYLLNPDDYGDSHLTIDRLTVRGRMDIYELVINQIRATNGALWVSDSVKCETITGSTIKIHDDTYITFVPGDIIKAQQFDGRNVRVFEATVNTVSTNTFTVTNVTGTGWDGMELVRVDSSVLDRRGSLYLTASDNNSPYLDVVQGDGSGNYSPRVRLGRLDGVGLNTGNGIWASNDGSNESFVISSSGYARIFGWSFDSDSLYTGSKLGINNSDFTLSNTGTYIIRSNNFNVLRDGSVNINGVVNITGGNAATQSYANGQASAAQSAAQSYADIQANNAQSGAETYTDTQISTFNSAKQDAVVNGNTIISGGYLNNLFIDTVWLTASVINTNYIEGLSLDFTQGTIGGLTIEASRFYSSLFEVNHNGIELKRTSTNLANIEFYNDTYLTGVIESTGDDVPHALIDSAGISMTAHTSNSQNSHGIAGIFITDTSYYGTSFDGREILLNGSVSVKGRKVAGNIGSVSVKGAIAKCDVIGISENFTLPQPDSSRGSDEHWMNGKVIRVVNTSSSLITVSGLIGANVQMYIGVYYEFMFLNNNWYKQST